MEITYRNRQDLLEQAARFIAAAPGQVGIDEGQLRLVAKGFRVPERVQGWQDYISAEAQSPYDIGRAAFELAMNAAQNAGYTEPDGQGGVRKWAIDGSGSKALKAFFREMRDYKRLPGIDLAPERVEAEIGPMLDGRVVTPDLRGQKVPFAAERMAIFKEFATPEAQGVIRNIVDGAYHHGAYRFTFENTVVPLREHFPQAFGQDPLCKKALLMPILLVANAQANGIAATTDVPLPADYRLPKALNEMGILHFSPELRTVINENTLLDQDDPRLLAIRGATLLACEQLRELTGLRPEQLDVALWNAAAPGKAAESLPESFAERLITRPPNSWGMYI